MKIAICVPCRDMVHAAFCFDLAKLVAHHSMHSDDEIILLQMPGTLIFDQRERLAKEALEAGADAILWIDSDMRFPSDMLGGMLMRNVPILGVNATTRREPILPTVQNLEIKGDKHIWNKVESRGKSGVEEVSAIGFGVCLTRKEVFEKMPSPWFDILWTEMGGIIGEDVHFCIKALDNGIPTFVDHDLSPFIKHIGMKEYGLDDIKYGPDKLQRPTGDDS
jgi:hypothetical protein